MVTSQFGALLQELEPFFKCKLEPDQNNSCLIKMANGLHIQLELDRYGENFLMGTRLGVVPIGRYREMIFKEALKTNESQSPTSGVFGYSKKSGNLILFAILDVRDINQEKMVFVLSALLNKAQKWAEALNRGEVPSTNNSSDNLPKPNLFGLIH